MKKIKFVFLLISTLLISASLCYAQSYEGKVESQYARIYENPNINSKLLRTATKGVELIVLEVKDNWCYVSVNSNKGWILKSDISIFYNKAVGGYNPNTVIDETPINNSNTEPVYIDNNSYYSNSALRYGLKAGISTARLIGDFINLDNSEYRTGFTVGAFMIYNITDNLGFQAEALYANKGGKGPISGSDATIKFDYIEIPLLIRYQFDKTNTPYLIGGFAFGVIVNNSLVTSSNTYIFDDIKKLDYGVTIGAGYQYEVFQSIPIHFELRYFHGLTTVNDANNPVDVKNTNLSLTIGFEL